MSDKSDKLRIEYLPLDKLPEAPRNPKLHALEDIKNSMRRFGFVQVPAINETTGRLVAGHGRKEALVEMQAAGENPPKRIHVKNGQWLVPVLRGVAFETDADAEAYLLADNRLSDLGGYDEAILTQALIDAQKLTDGLKGTGYTNEQVDSMIRLATGQDARAGDIDPAAEWNGMPGFEHTDQTGFKKIVIHFKDSAAVEEFALKCGYKITEATRALWYPNQEPERWSNKQYEGSESNPDAT